MVKAKPPSHTHEPILDRILREAWESKTSGRSFLAVFDLDSTLFDLTLRVATIVDRFREDPAHKASFPSECEALKNVQIRSTDWGLDGPLTRAGMKFAGTPFYGALLEYWAKCFFSSDYLLHDTPLPGAVAYVQELHQAGAELMYLTGRDIPRMLNGTEASLKMHRFPLGPTAHLILKPDESMDDAEFKRDVLREEEENFERIWLFENEPVNLNLISRDCPEIGLVYIESVHSGREEVQCELDRIAHFEHFRPNYSGPRGK